MDRTVGGAPLRYANIDTGMGYERLAAVILGGGQAPALEEAQHGGAQVHELVGAEATFIGRRLHGALEHPLDDPVERRDDVVARDPLGVALAERATGLQERMGVHRRAPAALAQHAIVGVGVHEYGLVAQLLGQLGQLAALLWREREPVVRAHLVRHRGAREVAIEQHRLLARSHGHGVQVCRSLALGHARDAEGFVGLGPALHERAEEVDRDVVVVAAGGERADLDDLARGRRAAVRLAEPHRHVQHVDLRSPVAGEAKRDRLDPTTPREPPVGGHSRVAGERLGRRAVPLVPNHEREQALEVAAHVVDEQAIAPAPLEPCPGEVGLAPQVAVGLGVAPVVADALPRIGRSARRHLAAARQEWILRRLEHDRSPAWLLEVRLGHGGITLVPRWRGGAARRRARPRTAPRSPRPAPSRSARSACRTARPRTRARARRDRPHRRAW